jgi:hypothetical protein
MAIILGALLGFGVSWVSWLFLRVRLQAKALARIDQRITKIGRRLQELRCEPGAPKSAIWREDFQHALTAPEVEHSRTYAQLIQSFDLQDLWARVRTRVGVGQKNNEGVVELTQKILRLLSEIEALIHNDFQSRAMAQIGDWSEEKIAFFRNSGERERASIAAIDQLVKDIKHELR